MKVQGQHLPGYLFLKKVVVLLENLVDLYRFSSRDQAFDQQPDLYLLRCLRRVA